jgi:hypothetical protein
MKKFHIEIVETYRETIEVEAESRDKAEEAYFDEDKGMVIFKKTIDYDYEIEEV